MGTLLLSKLAGMTATATATAAAATTTIMPIFTYCGSTSLGWSESRKRILYDPLH